MVLALAAAFNLLLTSGHERVLAMLRVVAGAESIENALVSACTLRFGACFILYSTDR